MPSNKCIQLFAIVLFSLLLQVNAGYSQSEETQVKAVIDKMFEGMRQADSASIVQSFAPNAIMQTIAKNKQQVDTIKGNTVAQFAGSVGKQKKGALDERISYANISIDANLAQVWTPYQFFLNGVFSHCGVNAFHLVKLNGEWKIQYIIDTRRKEGCL
ncbi:MAG TPA: nuclear transport factor 2 family protein [Phnomibacter sp.]|nr:nuclear transport factor 2 family protein [Phnomibacter sp.]